MRHRLTRRIRRPELEQALIHGFINNMRLRTTVERAKKLRPIIERFITIGRNINDENRAQSIRLLAGRLSSFDLANKLIKNICPLVQNRPGGYTRITKLGITPRKGDGAREAVLSIVKEVTEDDK